MSDQTPDPMDKAYAQAEAMLTDEAARAARRARVLTAVAGEPAAVAAEPARPIRRHVLGRGGWLVAASLVAGLSVVLAPRVYSPTVERPPAASPPTDRSAPPAVTGPEPAPAESASPAPRPRPAPEPRAAAAIPQAAKPAPRVLAESAPPPPPAPPAPPAAPSSEVQDLVVTGARIPAPNLSPKIVPAPGLPAAGARAFRAAPVAPPTNAASSSQIEELVVTTDRPPALAPTPKTQLFAGSPADRAARLRDAAAAGRTADVKALLRRVAVDAADDGGETALMKAVQANRPAAAALLHRRGASLDRKNHAGLSARDMAAAAGDAELNKALGLGP